MNKDFFKKIKSKRVEDFREARRLAKTEPERYVLYLATHPNFEWLLFNKTLESEHVLYLSSEAALYSSLQEVEFN